MNRLIPGCALAILIAGAGFATAAPAQPDNAAALAAVDHACRDILGTAPGEEHFSGCVASLSGSLNRAGAGATAGYDRVNASADASRGSYFTGSPASVHRREARACASVGINPAGQAFDSCVADLSSSMFAIDHPLN
jgi:hypothetical protein